jgi:hypothetical protein
MPLIGSRVDGDTVRTKGLAINSKLLDVGKITPSSISQGCNFIDVYTQFGQSFFGLKLQTLFGIPYLRMAYART